MPRREANDRWWLTKRPGHEPRLQVESTWRQLVKDPDDYLFNPHQPRVIQGVNEVEEVAAGVAVVDEAAVEVVAEVAVVEAVAEAVEAVEEAVVETTTMTTTIPPPRVLQALPDDVDDAAAPIDC